LQDEKKERKKEKTYPPPKKIKIKKDLPFAYSGIYVTGVCQVHGFK